MEGTVKSFNSEKGFGFIAQDGGGPDILAHYAEIQMAGFQTLEEGQRVEFEVEQGRKGLQAQNVRLLDADIRRPQRILPPRPVAPPAPVRPQPATPTPRPTS